jgi:ABC-2 type transport system ATP-binding protein
MLEAVGLTKDFASHRALDTLDLRVEPGEIVCLLGANGAGKTTTINLFLGFLNPTAGEARVDGVDVRSDPVGTKRKLLYVPEQIAQFGELTGLENLAYFAALSRIEDRSPVRLRQCLSEAGSADVAVDRRAAGY